MKTTLRWSVLSIAFLTIALGGLFLSDAFARQKRGLNKLNSNVTPSAPIYVPGNFTFAAPQELTGHPPSLAFYQADAEPEIAIDIFGTIYATAIQGVPGGTDLWKSTDKGNTFVYLGQPDGMQDHCNPPVVQCNATDGGKTFPSLVEITALQPLDQVNVESNLVVDPFNGNLYTAYIPNAALNTIKLASSTDGGTTWNITTAYTGPVGSTARGVFPNLAIDRGGNLHMVFTKSDNNATHTYCNVFLMSTANPS